MAAPITFKTIGECARLCENGIKRIYISKQQYRLISRSIKVHNDSTTEDASATSSQKATEKRDPFPIFVDGHVQNLLTRMTGFDMLKVAGPHKKPLERPIYKLLTDEELEKETKEAEERLRVRLQIPPFMNPRKPFLEPLAVDPDLAGFDTSDYVFTDVTFGVKDRNRMVVMRMTDGTLRIAPWDVKERMNQIYNPREGREYIKPSLFKEENLSRLIAEKKYIYILDRACCQFEPDDPDFIRTTHAVYSAVNKEADFGILRSTRHFGSLVFYLTWYQSIDKLLIDMLARALREDAKDLVKLYCIIHPDQACATAVSQLSTEEEDVNVLIQTFIKTESKPEHRSELELSLQAMSVSEREG